MVGFLFPCCCEREMIGLFWDNEEDTEETTDDRQSFGNHRHCESVNAVLT